MSTNEDIGKYNLSELIKDLKTFRFPFINQFQEYEYDELLSQAERIKEESESYINFLKYSKEKTTK